MAKTSFEHIDFDEHITAKELHRILGAVINTCPDAVVTVRQCTGTDFPPFITIESPESRAATEEAGAFAEMLL